MLPAADFNLEGKNLDMLPLCALRRGSFPFLVQNAIDATKNAKTSIELAGANFRECLSNE